MYTYDQFAVEVVRDIDEDKHFHSEMEILYVLEGNVKLQIRDKSWIMGKDDIIVVNSGVQHKVLGEEKNILCIVKYDYQILAEVISQSGGLFMCNSCAETDKYFGEVRRILRELIYEEIVYSRKTRSYKYSLFYHLLDELIEHFMIENLQSSSKEYEADEKLQRVIHYIHLHYQDGVSLSELAGQMFISTSTLSRFFKKQTGIYFADYVSQIRIKYAVNELLYSNKNITKVAMDCGFSNASAFNKVFREKFHCAPTEYRLKMLERLKKQKEMKISLNEGLRLEIKEKIIPQDRVSEELHVITVEVDTTKTVPLQKTWNKFINIGGFYNLTRANVQYHLMYLVEHLEFTHARIWSVFTDKMMVTDGKSIGNYNYDNMDVVFDFLVQNHVKPWLDFFKRPDTAIRSAGHTVWFEENAIQFASRRAWEAFFEDFVRHLVRRYGKEEMEDWVFEFGMDPFHQGIGAYYEDCDYDYCNVFEYAYRIIKDLVPNAAVGGPTAISNGDVESLEVFLNCCKRNGCIPDFISFGLFPYIPNYDKEGEAPYLRSPDPNYETGQIAIMKSILKRAGLEECKLYITEWNSSVSNRNILNDSCFRGLYICKKLSECYDQVDSIGLWTGSDWVSSYYDSYNVVNGGSGLLTKDGIRKPAFYALNFLNRLADLFIAKGKNYIITKSQNDSYEILCFNFNWYSVNYFLETEDVLKPQEVDSVMAESSDLSIHIVLDQVTDQCEFIIKKRTVNTGHGSVLDEWGAFQYEKRLERQDIKYLHDICIPDLSMQRVKSHEGKLNLNFRLKRQEFALYHIFPVDE